MKNIFEFQGPTTVRVNDGQVSSVAFDEHCKASIGIRAHNRVDARTTRGFHDMVRGWHAYAEGYKAQYSDPDDVSLIGNDGYAAHHWEDIGRALLALLSMDNGGFDGGSMDHNIRECMREHGIDLSEND